MRYVLMTIALAAMLLCAGISIALSLVTVALGAMGAFGPALIAFLLALGAAVCVVPTASMFAHVRRIR